MAATVTQLAFLIQLRQESAVEENRFTGRVEHVASGAVAHFQSADELLAFIARVLREVRDEIAREVTTLPLI